MLVLCSGWVQARTAPNASPGTASTVALASLPPEGRETYALILRGGPFRFAKDGVVFGNREGRLPARKRGYYREYTVAALGAPSRGAKRVVCGGPPLSPEICYYSSDHYARFMKIVP